MRCSRGSLCFISSKPPDGKMAKISSYFSGKAGFSLHGERKPAGMVRPMGSAPGELQSHPQIRVGNPQK